MRKLLLGGAVAALCVGLTAQSPLTTLFGQNNGGSNGWTMYFDLQVNNGLTVTQLDLNLYTGSVSGSIDMYTCPTSYIGNDTNPAAWTLVASGPITANPMDTPSPCALAAPAPLPPGSYGIALVHNNVAPAYSNGNGTATPGSGTNQTYANPDLTLLAGASAGGSIGTAICCTPRIVNISIHYTGGLGNYATKSRFGDGCTEAHASFYETFTAGIDLNGTSLQAIDTGNGYLVLPGGNQWYTPTSTPIAITDDQVVPFALGWTLPYPGGITTDLWVSSNGFVYLTNQTASGCCSGVVGDLLSSTYGPRWAALWFDLNPGAGGAVYFDSDPVSGTAYVTFDQVPQYSTSNLNTFQYRFDQAGNVELRWQSCACVGNPTLIGWSPGANNLDPGPTDLSAITSLVTQPVDITPLTLSADVRPVLGTTVNLTIGSIPTAAVLSALIYGLGKFDPGIPLAGMGMQGCYQFASMDAVVLAFGAPSATLQFLVPNNTALSGVHVVTQGASYAPAAGLTGLGAITSNGIDLGLDVN